MNNITISGIITDIQEQGTGKIVTVEDETYSFAKKAKVSVVYRCAVYNKRPLELLGKYFHPNKPVIISGEMQPEMIDGAFEISAQNVSFTPFVPKKGDASSKPRKSDTIKPSDEITFEDDDVPF